MDKLRTRKHPERIAKANLAAAQLQLAENWRAVKRQAALQEEVLAKEKGKDTAAAQQEENGNCPELCMNRLFVSARYGLRLT